MEGWWPGCDYLTEPLAYGLVQVALWAWDRGRRGATGGLLALAALAKETTLIVAAGLLLCLALQRRWRETAWLGLVTGLPFAAWQGVLWRWLGTPGVGAGGAMATAFEAIPFRGLLRVAEVSWPVFWMLLAIQGPLFVLPTVWALLVSVRDLLRGLRHPWITVLLAQAVTLPFLPFSTWREPLAVARLATGLVAATVLYGALRRSRRILGYSFLWLATLALLIDESALPI